MHENPERVLWGSDWPHPNARGYTPEPAPLLDALGVWGLDTTMVERVLRDNPAALYRFGDR